MTNLLEKIFGKESDREKKVDDRLKEIEGIIDQLA